MPLRTKVPVQNATLSIRLFAHELKTIKKAAKKQGFKKMAEFVRDTLLDRAKRVLGK